MDLNIGENLLGSLLFTKAKKNDEGVVTVNKTTDEKLKNLDLNNNGLISEKEIQKSLFDINGDKKISKEDLGVYTAFISFASNYTKNNSNKVSDKSFDVNKDGKLDSSEKALRNLFDSDNDGKIDKDMLKLFGKDGQIEDKLVKFLKKEKKALNEKLNPNEFRKNRVFDAKTGKLLSQIYIESDGSETKYNYTYDKNGKLTQKKATQGNEVKIYSNFNSNGDATSLTIRTTMDGKKVNSEYDIKYSYYEGTDTPKTKTLVNKNSKQKTTYSYDENGDLIKKTKYEYDKNGDLCKKIIAEGKKVETYENYDSHGKPTKMTKVTTVDGKKTTTEYSMSYEYYNDTSSLKKRTIVNNSTGKETVISYDKEGNINKKVITEGNNVDTYDNYDSHGKPTRMTRVTTIKRNKAKTVYDISYSYYKGTDTVKEKTVVNNSSGKKTVRKYDENGIITEKKITKNNIVTEYKYDENGELSEKYITKDGQLQRKEIRENGNIYKYTYTKYDKSGYPTEYKVEYKLANGIRTESIITQRKAKKSDNDYIVSAKNYQYINGKKLLVSTLETKTDKTKETKNGTILKEGTERVFYFYDENNKLIKTEKTFSFNSPEQNDKPIKTNSNFDLSQKLVTTYDPTTGNKKTEVTYNNNGEITTVEYDKNGKIIKTKTETNKDNSYKKHNLNNVSREDFIKEAEKYIGYNRIDGSYSIFGTNGSACATFATYIMYQLGFDLTSVPKRATQTLTSQAKNEGRCKEAGDIFDKLKNNKTSIKDLIKPGDLFTRMKSDGSGSHTTIVKEAKYTKDGKIELTVLGYESNSNSPLNGVKELKYTLSQDKNGKIILQVNKHIMENYEINFLDFIS